MSYILSYKPNCVQVKVFKVVNTLLNVVWIQIIYHFEAHMNYQNLKKKIKTTMGRL